MTMLSVKYYCSILLLFSIEVYAQDPLRFQDDVNLLIASDSTLKKKNIILFTGSSSIRFWASLATDFPKRNVVNRGFGGSEMSDLVYFADKLILPYRPKQIFIYEGDNDISNGKTSDEILSDASKLLALIRDRLSRKTRVLFISPKPSMLRWSLKDKYEAFNQKLKVWTKRNKYVTFVDVWTPMLEGDGTVRQDLFMEDGLHMNEKGYAIWIRVIENVIK